MLFSSRVISVSKMFIATLRVEIVLDVIWSRLLTFASCPKTKSPPVCGHLKGSAAHPVGASTGPAASRTAAITPHKVGRRIDTSPSFAGVFPRGAT